jgi:hypothetical protein
MLATFRELSQMLPFGECIWVTCACHVLNLYLLDQAKQVKEIKQLLAVATGVVDVFRIQAFHKTFLWHALPAEHSLCVSIIDRCFSCRLTNSAFSQLQLPVLVRFSSYAIMPGSMLKYRHALVSAVLSEDFFVASREAFKRRKDKGQVPPSEWVHAVLLAA